MVCNNSGTVGDCDGWLPFKELTSGTIWIDPSTEGDGDGCGSEGNPCKTIGYGLSQWHPYGITSMVVSGTVFGECRWEFEGRMMPIEKATPDATFEVNVWTSESTPFCSVG